MKALFGRKVRDLDELKDLTLRAVKEGQKGQPYIIIREVSLADEYFRDFADDFLKDQFWIRSEDGGVNMDGEVRCVRVNNMDTNEKVLVNSEGYDYYAKLLIMTIQGTLHLRLIDTMKEGSSPFFVRNIILF